MGRRALVVGVNDFETTHPELAEQWDYRLNEGRLPSHFMSGSQTKVWWLCDKGHSWSALITARAGMGRGCPVCSNKVALEGFNDLATVNPTLAAQWDSSKNGHLSASQVTAGSNLKAWWLCQFQHSWQAAISSRNNGRGCPICSNKAVQAGVNDVKTTHPLLAAQWDSKKNSHVTIQEVSAGSHTKVWWLCERGHSWEAILSSRLNGSGCPICSNKAVAVGLNDLATTHPKTAKQWDSEKNSTLQPTQVVAGSEVKVWWLCDLGHSWRASVFQRTRENASGCPVCSNTLTLSGFNDLLTTNPKLAAQWDSEKNGTLNASQVTQGSKKRVWWKCELGHSWQATIGTRNFGDSGCPICSNKQVLVGFNDLATTNAALLAQWDYAKNEPLLPTQIVEGSKVKVWWRCDLGHSFRADADARNRRGDGCPYCSGKAVLQGFNDLATQRPDLLTEWDFEKNTNESPANLTAMSNRKVWWRCQEGHSWRTDPNHRSYGRGCPRCADSGYDSSRVGLFYFIAHNEFNARKVGIMNPNRKGDRLAKWISAGWRVIRTFETDDGAAIRDTETVILRWIRKDLGLPPFLGKEEMGSAGGQTETFSMEGPTDTEIIDAIRRVLLEKSQVPVQERQ